MANPTFECAHMDEHQEIVKSGNYTSEKVVNSWKVTNPDGTINKADSRIKRAEDNTVYFVPSDLVLDFFDKVNELEGD